MMATDPRQGSGYFQNACDGVCSLCVKASLYECDGDDPCHSAGACAMCGGQRSTCESQSLLMGIGD